MRKFVMVACLAVGVLLFSMLEAKDTLVVGTNAEFVPFSFVENREIVGFDIDVAKEVCKRLDKKIVLKDMPFDALIPDLIFGNIDFIAAGMSRTDERAKRVLFTKPYLTYDPLVIFSLADQNDCLTGKVVVVNEGYTADLYMSERKDINLIRLATPADAFLAIMHKRADAFVTAESTVKHFLETQDAKKFRYQVIDGISENCALVVSKNNPELLDAIQRALDGMENDSTLNQLKKKWKLL